jgi:cyclin-dependent kinase 12/13
MDRYVPGTRAGSGTWGDVYLARDRETNRGVAVKRLRRIKNDKQTERLAKREVFILRALQDSPHVIKLLDVKQQQQQLQQQHGEKTTFLIMEQAQHDLRGLLEHKDISSRWTRSHIKGYAWQLLSAVAFCHERGFMHRDLKPSNVLVDKNNMLKLADFGLASVVRHLDEQRKEIEHYDRFTNPVATLWYRAIELLYGSRSYGPSIDVWSVGCIFGELLMNTAPLMPGKSDDDQLNCIYQLCGTPLENGWPEAASLPHWKPPLAAVGRDMQRRLITENKLLARKMYFTVPAVQLLDALLSLKPEARPTAREAMSHIYFDAASDAGIAVMAAQDMIRYNETSHFGKAK